MAIRFVDIEPEGGTGKAAKAAAPKPAPEGGAAPDAGGDDKLPLAKPEPKPRGRKKPLK